jgi:hypothetical protein
MCSTKLTVLRKGSNFPLNQTGYNKGRLDTWKKLIEFQFVVLETNPCCYLLFYKITCSSRNFYKQQRQELRREETLHFDPSKKLPIVENELSTVKNKGNMLIGVGKIDSVCKSCKTHVCYKGNEETEGCPWEEHSATMTRNSACSMCMKRTHSCPPGEPMRRRLRIPLSELWQVFAILPSNCYNH